MSADSDTATTTPTTADEAAPRSTTAVLAMLGAIIALPLLALLVFLVVNGGSGSSSGGEDVAEGVRENRTQAVYLANDRVFFGDLEAGDGDWVKLHDAYFLRAKAAEDAKDGAEAGATNLVPVAQEVGGDGTLVVNSREIVLVQNLSADAPIAQAIDDAKHK
jgi:hypothetical protein